MNASQKQYQSRQNRQNRQNHEETNNHTQKPHNSRAYAGKISSHHHKLLKSLIDILMMLSIKPCPMTVLVVSSCTAVVLGGEVNYIENPQQPIPHQLKISSCPLPQASLCSRPTFLLRSGGGGRGLGFIRWGQRSVR